MVKFYLPGLFEFFPLYVKFVDIFQSEREKFRDCEIGAIYGAPQDIIWNGGRNRGITFLDVNNIKNWSIVKNINCALTFTNSLIEEKHLNNVYCNRVAELFEAENNAIIIHSPLLEEYLRKKYPLYQFVSSTTKCITDFNDLEKELNLDYERVVLDYNFNRKFKSLKNIEKKNKCELLINAVCSQECPRRSQHYTYISESTLHIKHSVSKFECPDAGKPFFAVLRDNLNTIKVNEIYDIYEPMGFNHFKIEGRTDSVKNLIEILTYYMVKEEFQMEIRQRLNEVKL